MEISIKLQINKIGKKLKLCKPITHCALMCSKIYTFWIWSVLKSETKCCWWHSKHYLCWNLKLWLFKFFGISLSKLAFMPKISLWRFKILYSWFMEGHSDNNGLPYHYNFKNHIFWLNYFSLGLNFKAILFTIKCLEKLDVILVWLVIWLVYGVPILCVTCK